MTQDADVVKFMTDMKFDYKDLHMVIIILRSHHKKFSTLNIPLKF